MTNSTINTPTSESADVTVTSHAAANLVELLEHCERFLRTASPAVRAELHVFLTGRPNRPDTDLLIDLLGFNALYLQGKLATAHHTDQAGDRP